MLRSINPASLRASLVDNAPGHDAMSDPAGCCVQHGARTEKPLAASR